MEQPPDQVGGLNQDRDTAHVDHDSLISMPQGPITRSRAKKLQQNLIIHLQGLVKMVSEELQGYQSFVVNTTQENFNVILIEVEKSKG